MRLGILTSHPIQYQAPWFRELAKVLELEVFFCHRVSAAEQGAAGFGGVAFEWDIDLLSGYRHRFLRNEARHPGVNHFTGCDTPEIKEIIGGQRTEDSGSQGANYTAGGTENLSVSREASGSALVKTEITDNARSVFDAFIVCGWSLKSYWQAIRACRRAGIPVLVRGDSQLHTTRFLLKRALQEVTHRIALRQFDGFLAVGKRNCDYLTHYGVPNEKIFFAPHFVENERFAHQAEAIRGQMSEVRDRWRIPLDAFCILFCGKFIPVKRPLDVVKAAQLLLTDNSITNNRARKVHLLFVGSGELGGALRAHSNVVFDAKVTQRSENSDQRSERLNLTSDFRPPTSGMKPSASFAGFLNQTEISRAYIAADALVLPSESETWGLVVNEAMACGVPAIVSDAVGCAPDLIDEGKTGFTFSVGDYVQLAQRLETLAELKEREHNFRTCLASKLRDYSVDAAVRGTLEAIRSLT